MRWMAFIFTTSILCNRSQNSRLRCDGSKSPLPERSLPSMWLISAKRFRLDWIVLPELPSTLRSLIVRCARWNCRIVRDAVSFLTEAMNQKIVLGTRGSELARAQARLVEKAIQTVRPELMIETKIVATKGDKMKAVDLRAGRKGLFTAEIERALLAGGVDVAVHSAKDLPSETNPGATIAAVLPRASTHDVLVSKHSGDLAGLPDGATVATGSVRRKHQLLWKRADLKFVDLRGNVPTRLRKLAANEWDAIVLARAGLDRLGLSPARNEINFEDSQFFLEVLPSEIFLPAGGQGIIALQICVGDESAKAIVDPLNDRETLLCLRAA